MIRLSVAMVIALGFANCLLGDLAIERLIGGNAVRLLMSGEAGEVWTVEFSDDLESWEDLGEAGVIELDSSGKGEIVLTPTSDQQFYRALRM